MASKYAEVSSTEQGDGDASDYAPKSNRRWRKPDGWRLSAVLGVMVATIVFILNLVVLAWTLSLHTQNRLGISVIYTGSCDEVSTISTLGHLVINIIGSLLLAACNSCMQTLSAPTRNAIDTAHSQRRWLDVGVHTMRNFKAMSLERRSLWALLALSSVPLHLVYNSVLIESRQLDVYAVVLTTTEFLSGGSWNVTRASGCFDTSYTNISSGVQYTQANIGTLKRLDNADCIQAYSQSPNSQYGNLVVVTNASSNDTILNAWDIDSNIAPTKWMCSGSDTCSPDPSTWTLPGTTVEDIALAKQYDGGKTMGWCVAALDQNFTVEYCLAEPAIGDCYLGIAPSLLAVVLVCNIIKVACLLWALSRLNFRPLATVGDAVASFLEFPDHTTSGYGAIEASDPTWEGTWGPSKTPWPSIRRRGFSAISSARWRWSSLLFITFWVIAVALLGTGLQQWADASMDTSWAGIRSNGLTRVNPDQLVASNYLGQDLLSLSIFANIPQLLVSTVYLFYNDLLTRLVLAKEWAAFAQSHQPLRVSRPRGEQVGTHFLSLPWKIAAPFLGLSMVLHWTISQSIFLAFIDSTDYSELTFDNQPGSGSQPTLGVGWSPLGIILTLIIGGALILILWGFAALIRYNGGIPVVRSNSAAISAACHPAPPDSNMALHPVKYGVIGTGYGQDGRQHVGFSSGVVGPLLKGELYS